VGEAVKIAEPKENSYPYRWNNLKLQDPWEVFPLYSLCEALLKLEANGSSQYNHSFLVLLAVAERNLAHMIRDKVCGVWIGPLTIILVIIIR
jgi:hypothetical protein